jgi:hypothetical protein
MIVITSSFPILLFFTLLFTIFFFSVKLDLEGLTGKKIWDILVKKLRK